MLLSINVISHPSGLSTGGSFLFARLRINPFEFASGVRPVNIFQYSSAARERHSKMNLSMLSAISASMRPTFRPFF